MFERQILLILILLPLIAAFFSWLIGRKSERLRDIFNVAVVAVEFLLVISLYKALDTGSIYVSIPDIMGEGLYLKLDKFRYIFVFITSFVWLLATIYSTQYLIKYKNRNRYYAFFLVTLSSTIGVFVSLDLLNLFTFFEIMSFASYLLVIHDEDRYAHEAGTSYIAVAIIGGLVLLMGLFLLYDYTGTLNIELLVYRVPSLDNIKYLISALLLIGFGVKAGMVPLHIWLPKAHPAAPSPASAILSGILLKTGVFGIIITMTIMQSDLLISNILLVIGLITMFLGGLFAMLQKHFKRILAFSSVSQIGYIIVGIGLTGILGEHGSLAVAGTMLHMANHAIYKVLLFLGAGIIYMVLHEMNINIIRGFGRKKPVFRVVVLIGFLGLIGMPGFGGFISKTLLHEALVEAAHLKHSLLLNFAESIFTLSSSFTVAYMLKAFVTVFMEKNDEYKGQHKKHITLLAIIPLIVLAITVIILGIKPELVLRNIEGSTLAFNAHLSTDMKFFTEHNIINALIPMMYGLFIYVFILRGLLRIKLNDDKIYFNPIPDWVNLEQLVYIPIGKLLYKIGLVIFIVLDTAIISSVEWVSKAFRGIGEVNVSVDFSSLQRIELDFWKKINFSKKNSGKPQKNKIISEKIEKTKNIAAAIEAVSEKQSYSIASIFKNLTFKFNSIIYSIFIFATALVAILVFLVLK